MYALYVCIVCIICVICIYMYVCVSLIFREECILRGWSPWKLSDSLTSQWEEEEKGEGEGEGEEKGEEEEEEEEEVDPADIF